ncbi:MAG: DUF4465 domain-containing protein [Planctomycetota bacterium]
MASEKVMRVLCVVFVFGVGGVVKAEQIATFEDLTLGAESYWNGSDGSGGFENGGAWFNNNYDSLYESWDGFAYSNITDTSSSGWSSEYNAITGSGQGGSDNYAVCFIGWTEAPTMTLDVPTIVGGLYVTNNNYAYYSMLYGDAFAKKFGDDDWFLLTMTGKDAAGAVTGTVEFYLAEGTDILNNWRVVDLTSLGTVKSVEFGLSSSDTGLFGMNTPAYFVIDTVIPEPATMFLLGLGAIAVRRKK